MNNKYLGTWEWKGIVNDLVFANIQGQIKRRILGNINDNLKLERIRAWKDGYSKTDIISNFNQVLQQIKRTTNC